MNGWDFPEELLRLQEPPHVIRRWTDEEAALAAISLELQRVHEAIQTLLAAPVVAAAVKAQERLEGYRQGRFDWSQVRVDREFWRLVDFGTNRFKFTIHSVVSDGSEVPQRIYASGSWGTVRSDLVLDAEAFVACFGGWVDEDA